MATLSLDTERGRRRSVGGSRTGRQTKFQEVCGRLSDLAHELGPDAKLPTVLELRNRLGVSIATLDSVLTELESQRVVRRRHGVGIYVATDIRQYRVCLVCDPSFFRSAGTSPFWSLMVEKVRCRAEAQREAFSFHFATDVRHGNAHAGDLFAATPYLSEAMIDDLRNGRIDGVLGAGLPMVTADWIERQEVPFVSFAGPAKYVVGLDSDAIVRAGVAHLCGVGCKRIGFWAAVAPHRFFMPGEPEPTIALFAELLAANGRVFEPDLVWDNQHLLPVGGGMHSLSHQEQGYHAAVEAFGPHTDRADWPDGVFVADDMVTQGLLTALQRLHIRVGEDVQIATHANAGSPALLGWEDKITRLEIDPSELVARMFDSLEALMHGGTPPEAECPIKPRLRIAGDM